LTRVRYVSAFFIYLHALLITSS
jgi:STE24 endopeptidase